MKARHRHLKSCPVAELVAAIVEPEKTRDEQKRDRDYRSHFFMRNYADRRATCAIRSRRILESTQAHAATQEEATMKLNRKSVVLGAGALLLATAAAAQTRSGGSGIPISKDRPGVSSTPSTVTVVGGEVTLTTAFDLSAYVGKMNEKNITAHMAAADSLEIQLGQLAQSKGTSQSVRDYGTMLVTDHTAHLAKTHEIITDEDVGAEPMAWDPERLRLREMLTKLRSMPAGSNWDRAFVRFQVGHHQNEIDLLSANIKAAHDDDLEDHIEKSITSLGKHRDQGKSVGSGLGLTL